ncbi:MAG: PEP-CTERM sorting domain-containing protein [Burkholderiales bacterium]|nr:PEP-CTERM sorting domain-containing protein [Burkholderiales bacterium]
MRKLTSLLLLLSCSFSASAAVVWVPTDAVTRTETFNNIAGLTTEPVGSTLTIGDLKNTTGDLYKYTFTYLGQESGFNNIFRLTVNGIALLESDPVGTFKSVVSSDQFLSFNFEGNTGKFAINGGAKDQSTSIGLLEPKKVTSGAAAGTYAFILGYNDSAGAAKLGDWDDFVVGVNVTPVPEPEAYGLALAGMGVVGYFYRRRRDK